MGYLFAAFAMIGGLVGIFTYHATQPHWVLAIWVVFLIVGGIYILGRLREDISRHD